MITNWFFLNLLAKMVPGGQTLQVKAFLPHRSRRSCSTGILCEVLQGTQPYSIPNKRVSSLSLQFGSSSWTYIENSPLVGSSVCT